MTITFRYTSQLATAAGVSNEIVAFQEGMDLLSVLRELSANHGPEFAKFVVNEAGEIVPTLVVALNGSQISLEKTISLEIGAEVMLITPMSGG
ncbi:MAG: MoaD/ThiS family protein [Opitutales bacterium]|jgi:molybdopterin converting factor small subunit